MNKHALALLVVTGLTLSGNALALIEGRGSPYDFRIKSVVYNPVDVVRVDAIAGVATTIVVAPDETYVTHIFGAANSYVLSHVENNYFVKPGGKVPSDTNLMIVTNKRRYNIVLHYVDDYKTKDEQGNVKSNFIQTPWSMRNATLQLTYQYPFEDMQKANKKLDEKRVKNALEGLQNGGQYNLSYRMSDEKEDSAIQPVNVWDNYKYTYFKFPANASMPTLFYIGEDGKEHTPPNQRPVGENRNIAMVDTVAKEWRVRLGNKVVGLVNDGYNPSIGDNSSRTSSPAVKRVLKNDGGQE